MDEVDYTMGGIIGGLGALLIGIILSTSGAFGVREIKDEYSFSYQGKPAVVRHKNVRFGPDRFYILINEKDRIDLGNLVSDDGKIINIDGKRYSVMDAPETKE